MLGEKINYLIKELGTDGKSIAASSGMTPAWLSRMRSGARSYRKNSISVRKLAYGFFVFANEHEETERLCMTVGCTGKNMEEVCTAVIDWFFDDDPLPEEGFANVSPEAFGRKLRSLMELAGTSNSRLGRALNIDASYISRMRSGSRVPQRNSALMIKLCEKLAANIINLGRSEKLADMLGVPDYYITETEAPGLIYGYLYDRTLTDELKAVREIIKNIEAYPSQLNFERIPFAEAAPASVMNSDEKFYHGFAGLQNAVRRFLGRACEDGAKELLLYSDHSIEWMEGRFMVAWATLMLECADRGIQLNVIHNIDRSVPEMLRGIKSWMPLYMSGNIDPSYSIKGKGERFSHTLFISPGKEAIVGTCVTGNEENAVFEYLTDPELIAGLERSFGLMKADCRPLASVYNRLTAPPIGSTIYRFGAIELIPGEMETIVNKRTEPNVSFVIAHKLVCRAFREYASVAAQNALITENK
ncbi:MAG: helix-turn-helix domain-containing protein [Ruminococcus sp.]|nr:helix-turn-helix domain-containing protein [Ruminococcus sp.]